MPSVDDYLALIPSANRDKPRFSAVLRGLLSPLVSLQDTMRVAATAYDIDTAVGVQLDAVGVHVGRDRLVATPVQGVFFSWDDDALGWDRGVWQGAGEDITGVTALDDDTYRLVLRAKIAANHWDGSMQSAAEILTGLFGDEDTFIFVQDHGDMSFSLNVSGRRLNALFVALLKQGYIPLKPAGVRLAELNVSSVDGDPLFGWDMENAAVQGWGVGSWAEEL